MWEARLSELAPRFLDSELRRFKNFEQLDAITFETRLSFVKKIYS